MVFFNNKCLNMIKIWSKSQKQDSVRRRLMFYFQTPIFTQRWQNILEVANISLEREIKRFFFAIFNFLPMNVTTLIPNWQKKRPKRLLKRQNLQIINLGLLVGSKKSLIGVLFTPLYTRSKKLRNLFFRDEKFRRNSAIPFKSMAY